MLTSLSQSAFSVWLLSSNSIWAYPTVLTLHTFGMMVLVGSAFMIDLRLLGFGRGIPLHSMNKLFRVMWGAFALNAVTGTMLFIGDAEKRGPELIFWIKLAFVAVGLATAARMRRTLFVPGAAPALGNNAARGIAIVSLLAWSAAITAGRLLAYVE